MQSLDHDQLVNGRYRVRRMIGSGGMGEVYEVENAVLGGRAALKVLTCDTRKQPELFMRFQNEARAANQIGHPGVIPVYDLGQLDNGTPWLVMPFLDGETLSARMARVATEQRTPLGFGSTWIIVEIASALAAAHKKGIIHRDLKRRRTPREKCPVKCAGEFRGKADRPFSWEMDLCKGSPDLPLSKAVQVRALRDRDREIHGIVTGHSMAT